jgi:hypothetical protein
MTVKHDNNLVEHAHAGRTHQELHNAIAYCQTTVSLLDWMVAVGGAAATASPKEVMNKLIGESSTPYSPDEVNVGGVLGMLDVAYRVKPVAYIDIGRMRWA